MKNILDLIFGFFVNILKKHKLKVVSFFFFFFFFALILFPYNNFLFWLKNEVQTATKGQVEFEYKDIKTSFVPLSIEFQSLNLASGDKSLALPSLEIRPSPLSFLLLSPGFGLKIPKIFSGNMDLSFQWGLFTKLDLKFENANMEELLGFLAGWEGASGSINAQSLLKGRGMNFKDGKILVSGRKIYLPDSSFPSSFGRIELPQFSFSQISSQILFSEGENIHLKSLEMGGDNDPFILKLEGRVKIDLSTPFPKAVGAYFFDIFIKKEKGGDKRLDSFLLFLDKYKKDSGRFLEYQFKASGKSLMAPPKLESP